VAVQAADELRELPRICKSRSRARTLELLAAVEAKDITVSQTMLRHAKPDTTAIYTHGNFDKALDAQRMYLDQLLKIKSATEST
jgi:site-specific recombinase XerC